jgi:glycosyltransferase involved in cell wall biosynthesis
VRFIPWQQDTFCEFLVQGNIGIAPLAWRRRFYWQQAANKVQILHAAGLPVVASDIPAYRHWIQEGRDGYLASTTQQWVDAITTLCENWQLRAEMGRRGGERAWNACSPGAIARQWMEVLECVAN